MGAQNERLGTTGNLKELESSRQKIQYTIDAGKTVDQRRQYGQFATPFLLADEMVSYGLGLLDSDYITFLDPSIGTGVFYSALIWELERRNTNVVRASGVDVDGDYLDGARSVWCGSGIKLYREDFTRLSPDGKYNFLVANPPYVRHHYIPSGDKIILNDLVRKETGIDISGLSGLYCYFILLAHKWLAPGAICGWLVPSEFMDVNYGAALKEYLLNKVHLLRIHRYAPEEPKFDDALVSSCVIWFRNECIHGDHEVCFSYGGTHDDPAQSKEVKRSTLSDEKKWTRFPGKEVRRHPQYNATIGNYFTIKRGLATGDNKFFILAEDKIKELCLDQDFLKPILPSPRYLKTDFVEADADGRPKIEGQYFLLDCKLPEEEIRVNFPATWDYLQTGRQDTGVKYLCRSRKKWYWQEQREPTRFLCSYMGRGKTGNSPIRFILNLSDAIVTNSYLMLYPKENLQCVLSDHPECIYRIWDVLKNISADQIEDEGRIYGGGLKKIEPGELAKVSCDGLREICGF